MNQTEIKKTETQSRPVRGLSLRFLNLIMIVLSCVLSVVMLIATTQTWQGFRALTKATSEYMQCAQDASDMQRASDYLKAQARSFVITGERQFIENYYFEVEIAKRRDNALDDFREYLSATELYTELSDALDRSNALAERESYAMRLVCDLKGYDAGSISPLLESVRILPEDDALPDAQKQAAATDLVFGSEYEAQKAGIDSRITHCTETLTKTMMATQQTESEMLRSLLIRQQTLIIVLLAAVVGFFLLIALWLIRPIRKNIRLIQNHEDLPVNGFYELQYLARTFNEISEKNRSNQSRLEYDARHDALTGLLNRGEFERIRKDNRRRIAFILLDVDDFKKINDRFGHDMGDRALKKVAGLLHASFRAEDYVFRTGGDEFAIIMVYADSSMQELIRNKFRRITEKLADTSDGLPPITLSVGVAFYDRQNPTEDIYKDADTALYRVKEAGRNGVAFY